MMWLMKIKKAKNINMINIICIQIKKIRKNLIYIKDIIWIPIQNYIHELKMGKYKKLFSLFYFEKIFILSLFINKCNIIEPNLIKYIFIWINKIIILIYIQWIYPNILLLY